MPQEFYHRFMYIAPSNDHNFLNPQSALENNSKEDVWGENDALFQRLMKIHSNQPILWGLGFSHWHKITALILHLIGGTKCGVSTAILCQCEKPIILWL